MNAFKMKTAFYTALALLAFAGNSVLCRLALADGSIDAASFTNIRLLSGLAVLALIAGIAKGNKAKSAKKSSWIPSILLFLYAATFSYGYLSLDTGVGALILFGAVQITIILSSLFSGYRLHVTEWIGMAVAFSGFTYLVAPSLNTPSFSGFILMSVSGIAWALYTLKGLSSKQPIVDTHFNFFKTLPMVGLLALITFQDVTLTLDGFLLAFLSGGFASGLGYVFWYKALDGISMIQAAVLQLFVPVIAALGGIVFASEAISLRLTIASTLVLGGIFIVTFHRYRLNTKSTASKVT